MRCSSRTEREPTCARRPSPRWPTRWPTPGCRHCVSTSRIGPRDGVPRIGRRCSRPQCAMPPECCAAWRSCPRIGSCWAGVPWAVGSVRWSRPIPSRGAIRSDSCCSATRCTRPATPRSCASSTSRGCGCRHCSSAAPETAFASPAELRRHAKKVTGPVTFHWVETGDHGFKPLKSSGSTVDSVLADVATTVVEFVTGLPERK